MELPVVFLGPSYKRACALNILPALYHPPARRGDLFKAAKDGAKNIVLIDGYMIYEYPPSPAEVYDTIQQGVLVYGAASLGALRAVELLPYGICGVGWVYQRYLDGTINADDEVVVSIDPRTGNAASVPLVQVRFAVEKLSEIGALPESQGQEMIQRLKEIYCEDRTVLIVRKIAESCGIKQEIIAQILSQQFDVKALDTIECLSKLAKREIN